MVKNNWKLGFANVNGILGKRDSVKCEIVSETFDAYGVVESKIDPTIIDKEINKPGYSLFRQDRKKGGGGIVAYIKSEYSVVRLKQPSAYNIDRKDLETLSLRIGTGPNFIICIYVYIPKTCATTIDCLYEYIMQAFGSQLH